MRNRLMVTSPPTFKDLVTYLVSALVRSTFTSSSLFCVVRCGLYTTRGSGTRGCGRYPRSYMFLTTKHATIRSTTYDAGSDNTSITMSMALFFLTCEPRCVQILRDELEQAFSDPLSSLDHTKLATLPYLASVINETLRLSSPFFLPRVVPDGGATVDGKFIPGDTTVVLAAYSQQISPDNFYPRPLVGERSRALVFPT